MKKNVGTFDAFLRIMCGLTGIAWGTARMVRSPYRSMPLLVTMFSAMKVAEGITRFCPMLAMLKMNSEKMDQFNPRKSSNQQKTTEEQASQESEEWPPYPPSYPISGEHE